MGTRRKSVKQNKQKFQFKYIQKNTCLKNFREIYSDKNDKSLLKDSF